MIYCFPIPGLISFVLAICLIALIRYISLGSMLFMVTYTVILALTYHDHFSLFVILWSASMALMCILRHHANIGRLIHGTENKLGNKVKQDGR